MSCFLQGNTGDLQLTLRNGSKTLSLVTDVAECAAQKLTNRFLLWLGEWFLDTSLGLPFFQQIAVKNPNLKNLQALFTKVVLGVPGIASVSQLILTLNARRQAMLNLIAQADDGSTIVGGEGPAFVVQ